MERVRNKTASYAEPFLFKFREQATLDDVSGHYDAESDTWLVSTSEGDVPLVLLGPERSGTETITRVRAETSDED